MDLRGPTNFQPDLLKSTSGAILEHVVLSNSKQFFRNYPQYYSTPQPQPQAYPQPQPQAYHHHDHQHDLHHHHNPGEATEKWRAAAKKVGGLQVTLKGADKRKEEEEEELLENDDFGNRCCNQRWCWWNPPLESIPVVFCHTTSIHGLKFMGEAKRHFTERFFWLVAFFLSLGGAVYLIYGVWDRYNQLPVVVTFQAMEQDIDSIPFPAVTICNMNIFPRSKVMELDAIAKDRDHELYFEARQQLTFVRSVCNSQQSFAKDFKFAFHRGTNEKDSDNDIIPENRQHEMMDFLLRNTLPCDQLVRLCILGEEPRNCSRLFKPIITDYGKCCVFNILPLPILLKNPQNKNKPNASIYDNPLLGRDGKKFWPHQEIKEWEQWNYDAGFILPRESTKPWKQKRAGLPYGLSVLVDPHTEDYYCPVSDSEGVRYILHTPLEMPHVMEFSSVADLNKEILIEVHPDITNADEDIRDIEHDKRNCFYGKERNLNFFHPYTGGNCVDECTAIVLGNTCKCTFFFMPRDVGVKICNNDPDSVDYKCIEQAQIDLQATLKENCGHCDSLCEDIAYNYETTIATLQDSKQLWKDVNPKAFPNGPPSWAGNKMSVIHIFFGSETTVPKFRKRLYGTTDLIANTGGILGLCLGFSILSGVEVIYFVTLRSFWKYCRRRRAGRRIAHKFLKMFKSNNGNSKVIQVNPTGIPVYPAGYSRGYRNTRQVYDGSNNGGVGVGGHYGSGVEY